MSGPDSEHPKSDNFLQAKLEDTVVGAYAEGSQDALPPNDLIYEINDFRLKTLSLMNMSNLKIDLESSNDEEYEQATNNLKEIQRQFRLMENKLVPMQAEITDGKVDEDDLIKMAAALNLLITGTNELLERFRIPSLSSDQSIVRSRFAAKGSVNKTKQTMLSLSQAIIDRLESTSIPDSAA